VSSGVANQAKQHVTARRIFTTHGRGGANQAAMQTLRAAKSTSKLPRAAQHAAGMSRYPSNLRRGGESTAGNALACVRECDEPVRADENVPSRQNGLLGERFQEMIYPVIYYDPCQ